MPRRTLPLALGALALVGCAVLDGQAEVATPPIDRPSDTTPSAASDVPLVVPSTTARAPVTKPVTSTTTAPTTAPTTAGTTSTTATTSTTTSTSRSPNPAIARAPLPMPSLDAVVADLARANLAVSVSVWRDGAPIHRVAAGSRVDGRPVDHTTPFTQASVSKVITALTVVRLAADGRIDLDAPPPWTAMWMPHHPEWDTVTVRELMTHESGMPIAADAWLGPGTSCALPLSQLLRNAPVRRGEWAYSNGNYCALGLLVEHLTGERYDVAARRLVLDPAGAQGGHLSLDGLRAEDAPYPLGLARLDRLGAAGQWVMSTDDVAAVLSAVTARDRRDLRSPAVLEDPLGWGHTGTIMGAKSCAWVVDGGRTAVVATIAGNQPERGSLVCARVLPAVIADLPTDITPAP